MEDNLLPTFSMRESGATVNDTPKIHCTDSTSKDHCIKFSGGQLKIPLNIKVTFSFFHTSRRNYDELRSCDKIYVHCKWDITQEVFSNIT